MDKIAIITRAYNRLEYTSLCIREIEKKIGNVDYEHIIIEQNSSDGTKQFLNSLLREGYYNLKVKFNDHNSGDAVGMHEGFQMIDDDTNYIMQFDNDCHPLTNSFGQIMIDYMNSNKDVGALMMKREGVWNPLPIKNIVNIKGHEFGDIDKVTCCFMTRREILERIKDCWFSSPETIGWGFHISKQIKKMGCKLKKTNSIKVEHTDGTSGQVKKYPNYCGSTKKTKKPTNFKKINY